MRRGKKDGTQEKRRGQKERDRGELMGRRRNGRTISGAKGKEGPGRRKGGRYSRQERLTSSDKERQREGTRRESHRTVGSFVSRQQRRDAEGKRKDSPMSVWGGKGGKDNEGRPELLKKRN